MAKKRNPKSKDPAVKNTFNPPGHKQETQAPGVQHGSAQVGQFTGEGAPGLQKK